VTLVIKIVLPQYIDVYCGIFFAKKQKSIKRKQEDSKITIEI
jgi:hypothetical protein